MYSLPLLSSAIHPIEIHSVLMGCHPYFGNGKSGTGRGSVACMHELGVTQNILEIALEHAQKVEARKIRRIHLVIGGLAGILDESVQFYFGFVSKGTIAEGAELTFEKKPAILRCRSCGHEFSFEREPWTCPACQAPGPEIVSGREFFMEHIEVD